MPPQPKNWPSTVPYLTHPVYSPTLTPSHLTALRTRPNDSKEIPPNTPKGPCPLVRIIPITTPSHPACGQSGLFAVKDLKPGTFILQYVGEIHASPLASSENPIPIPIPDGDSNSPSQTEPGTKTASAVATQPNKSDPHASSNYDLSLDREIGLGIDADKKGNEARFINDYRGVGERPNAEFREIWDAGRKERGMGVWVLPEGKSGRGKGGVRKGEEILVSYGRGFWGARRGE
ncbi:SET domain-containing protein [Rhexocercosporidium sp. MPI-PUGE-AT-0058]|nr:SET domain-containing protein [Rhexocercosporidium sp. MPI-PUGE-AT-0058]